MVKSNSSIASVSQSEAPEKEISKPVNFKKLTCMGKISQNLINELCGSIDALNRFLNLTLETVEENSQTREFLLEAKKGSRNATNLLGKLCIYAKKMELEANGISKDNESTESISFKQQQSYAEIPI